MAKDPAFLFYSSDFLSGTQLLTYEQRGKYITLLCLQHQQGHLKDKHIQQVCGNDAAEVMEKFAKDEQGLYYSPRLEIEMVKRRSFADSRRENRNKAKHKYAATKTDEPVAAKKEKTPAKAKVAYPFDSKKFMKVWQHWKSYKSKEHDFEYASAQSEQAALTKLAKLSDGAEGAAIAIITESMANGWKGFFELKNNKDATGHNTGQERNAGVKRAIHELIGNTAGCF